MLGDKNSKNRDGLNEVAAGLTAGLLKGKGITPDQLGKKPSVLATINECQKRILASVAALSGILDNDRGK